MFERDVEVGRETHKPRQMDGSDEALAAGDGGSAVLLFKAKAFVVVLGVALGVEEDVDDAARVLAAIAAHKAFAAFALGLSLVRGGLPRGSLLRVVGLFAAMSPLGVVLGAAFALDGEDSVTSGTIQAFAAGSFIYVALVEIILSEFDAGGDQGLKFVAMLAGVVTMLSL